MKRVSVFSVLAIVLGLSFRPAAGTGFGLRFQVAPNFGTTPLSFGSGRGQGAPGIVFSTYLGGRSEDRGYRIAVDPAGAVYVAGFTSSRNFPPREVYLPRRDIFVAKLTPDGKSLVYSAFFPVETWEDDMALGLAVDSKGAVYLAGTTFTRFFPVKNAVQEKFGGRGDSFVLKLAPAGNALVYSTYLGGTGEDRCLALAVDACGAAYVAGWTESHDFPVKSAYQKTPGGMSDGFVAKIAPDGGSLVYSTYLGHNKNDRCSGLAVDASGAAVVAGWTESRGFPLKHAFQGYGGGLSDAFVSKLAPNGKSLVFSTFLGGGAEDKAAALALDSQGCAYIAGTTRGDFPVKGGVQGHKNGWADGFVTKLSADGRSLLYSTYLGGAGEEEVGDIAVDGAGAAYVVGRTNGPGFPIKEALTSNLRGNLDGFLAVLGPGGKGLQLSTYLGGFLEDTCWGVALGKNRAIYLTGQTNSLDFPVKSPYQEKYRNERDGFVMKLKLGSD